ncbi:MAG TPA: PAS domain S-box protein, partial [Candidatus Udaeobacter sp.]|nr:PAS domain S-box protein [Candidatus Udaeobacter sp.]
MDSPADTTSAAKLRVLIVEDNPDDAQLMMRELRLHGLDFTATVVESESSFLAALALAPDVILCDHSLPQFGAQRAMEILRERSVRLPVLVVSGTITDELAVRYMQQGAFDYVLKDRLRRLGPAVRNAVERFRLETEAVQANLRLSRLLNDLDVAQLTTDLYGNVLDCNDIAWKMLGFASKAEAIAQRTTASFADPHDRTVYLQALAEKGAIQDYEIPFRRQDGAVIWTTGHYYATRDEDGKIVAIQALIVDSTSRKEAEKEAVTSRLRLDTALKSAPLALVTLDHDLVFTFAGGTALARVGLGAKAMVGRPASEVLHDRPDIVEMCRRAAGGEEFVEELLYRGRYFHAKFSPVRATGSPPGAGFVAVDITARHEAELKSEARARQQAAVRRFAQEALASVPVQTLLERAVRLLVDALGADVGSVFEVQAGGRTARRVVALGFRKADEVISVTDGIPGWLVSHAEVRAIDQYLPEDNMPWIVRESIQSFMSAPIRDEKRVFGVLSAGNRRPHQWTSDERELIELMAKTLWVAVERRRLEDERAELVRRLVDAQEDERRRIAADVHDDAVQVMSAVTMRLHLLAQKLTDPNERELVAKLQSTVSLAIERLRNLLFELSPPALEQQGLQVALRMLADEFERDHGIVVQIAGGLTSEPDPACGLTIYRIAQEALINVQKHAQAG